MFESLLIVAQQVGILFALMAVGFVCNKRRIVDAASIKGIVEVLVLIVTPCVIVQAFQRPFNAGLLKDLGWAFAIAALIHAFGIASAYLFRGKDRRQTSVLKFAVAFPNAGFMGIPLEYALLGNDGVFFGSVYVAMFNVVCWSWGLVTMCGSLKEVRTRTLFLNPGTIGLACGLPFFLFSLQLPGVVATPVKMLADLNTPLAMLVIGFYLADASFGTVLRCRGAYATTLLRLVLIPLAVVGALWAIRPANATMVVALITAASAPVAAMTTIFAAKYDRDVTLSVGLVSGTTLLSILTMPPIVGLAMWLFLK